MSFRNYFDKVRRYFLFSAGEWGSFLLAVVVLAFIVSWTKWGDIVFDPVVGFQNLLRALVLVAVALFVHHAGQRLFALLVGFRVEHFVWWNGVLVSVLLAILTDGRVQWLAVVAFGAHLLPVHRIGSHRYGVSVSTVGKIALAGPVANIFFAGFVKTLEFLGLFPAVLSNSVFRFNLVFAAWNLLPVPPLDGSKVFYASRLAYVFVFGCILGYVLLILLFGVYSYILAVLFGVLCWLIFFYFEKGLR